MFKPNSVCYRNLSSISKFSSLVIKKRNYSATNLINNNKHVDNNDSDDTIIKVFDDNEFWNKFNSGNQIVKSSSSIFGYPKSPVDSVGLFQNPYLKTPKGLKDFTTESLKSAQKLTEYMISDNSNESLKNCIKNLDRLSDILCRVIDLCEFVRVAHPNSKFVEMAQECHEEMFQYMNILNTSKNLFDKLDKALNDPNIKKTLSDEEISVGNLLYSDFKKSGIDMDERTREQFVELSQYIANTGQLFSNNITESNTDYVEISKDQFDDKDIAKEFVKFVSHDFNGNLRIPIYGRVPYEILRSCPNRIIREKIWLALHSVTNSQIITLTNFLKCRGILSRLMGSENFSQYQLNEKMAKNQQNVMEFLKGLINDLKPGVLSELKTLYKDFPNNLVENPTYDQLSKLIRPWDRDYLMTLHLMKQKSSNSEDITKYFSIGTVVQGLSNLFNTIYGIHLKPSKVNKGELWSSDVRKFDVVSETEGKIGIIYLDLFYRQNKTPHPAHFTVCCSRKIYPNELDLNDQFNLKLKTFQTIEYKNEIYQLPVISLVCNFFPAHSNNDSKTFLTLDQVATLFHEMGHAMHSMLGRTNLHNVSGTRCATDFVELPSILTEQFAKDERVLLSFAKHYKTKKPLSKDLLLKHLNNDNFLNKSETFGQVKMAILDQILHSDAVFNHNFDVVKIYHELEKNMLFFSDDISNWPGKFGHLYSYGAVYYSYLLDRAIAAKIWEHLFSKNPLDRASGEKFKNQVLKWGGSRDPWDLVANVLDKPELKKGDLKAMEFISKASSHM